MTAPGYGNKPTNDISSAGTNSVNEVNARFAATALCDEYWFACKQIASLGQGRINDTYKVIRALDDKPFVLQRLSPSVFPQGLPLMQQTARVVAHLQTQHAGWVPQLVPATSGEVYALQLDGMGRRQIWRLWEFISDARPRTKLSGNNQLRNAGAAFAYTQELLLNLPGPRLQDPIPHLFDLGYHFAELDSLLVKQNPAANVGQAVTLAQQFRELISGFSERNGYIHGDCKPQNLMYQDGSDFVASVVDLDTVMYGHWAWDFGDLARSAAVGEQGFSLERFVPLLRGFVQASPRDHAADSELLSTAPAYVASCLGLRYLNDHLQGDIQFKVARHGDNLRRAHERLGLAAQLRQARSEMEAAARQAIKA